MNPRARQSGMTLFEVMIAFTIAAAALTVLVTAANKCVAGIRKAKLYDDCRILAAEVDRNHPLQLDELEEDSESGQFDGEYTGYSWQRDVTLFTEEEDDGVYKVATRILWQSKGQPRSEEFVSLLHLPTAKRMGFISEDAVDK